MKTHMYRTLLFVVSCPRLEGVVEGCGGGVGRGRWKCRSYSVFVCGHGLISGRNKLCTHPSPSIFMRIDRCAG